MACIVFENISSARASSPLASLRNPEPYIASHRLYLVPHGCYRPCSGRQRFIEHLACAQSTSSPRADRAPPHLKPRQSPCLVFLYVVVQSRLLRLSFLGCPRVPPLWPVDARHRARTPEPLAIRIPLCSLLTIPSLTFALPHTLEHQGEALLCFLSDRRRDRARARLACEAATPHSRGCCLFSASFLSMYR
jgi:hypothetical protein